MYTVGLNVPGLLTQAAGSMADTRWKEGVLKYISSAVGDEVAQSVSSCCQCGRMKESVGRYAK